MKLVLCVLTLSVLLAACGGDGPEKSCRVDCDPPPCEQICD
jgi:hypothetical protein